MMVEVHHGPLGVGDGGGQNTGLKVFNRNGGDGSLDSRDTEAEKYKLNRRRR